MLLKACRQLTIIVIPIFSSACSLISYDTYYSPSSEYAGIATRTADIGHEHVGFATGLNDTLQLEFDGLTLTILSGDMSTRPVLLGPIFLPVIPAIPFWFSEFYESEDIQIIIKLDHANKPLEINYAGIKLHHKGTVYLPDSINHWSPEVHLSYLLPSMQIDKFTIHIGQAKITNNDIELPPITFEKAHGWVMDSAP